MNLPIENTIYFVLENNWTRNMKVFFWNFVLQKKVRKREKKSSFFIVNSESEPILALRGYSAVNSILLYTNDVYNIFFDI